MFKKKLLNLCDSNIINCLKVETHTIYILFFNPKYRSQMLFMRCQTSIF